MADLSKDELRKEINAILKDADLSTTSAKKVRQQIEEKYGENLSHRKEEIDELVMNYVNSREDGSEENRSEEDGTDEDEKDKKKAPKRAAPAKKVNSKKKKEESSSENEESEEESNDSEDDDESFSPKKPVPKKKAPKRKGKGSDSDSDSDWGKGGGGGGGGGGRGKKAGGARGRGGKGGGYTRAYKLSPQLASLMGKDSMARHEVVKKMWALIKERNLYDPNNKQFAICDDDLLKVMGVKRFRTFGMMKYLKSHFSD